MRTPNELAASRLSTAEGSAMHPGFEDPKSSLGIAMGGIRIDYSDGSAAHEPFAGTRPDSDRLLLSERQRPSEVAEDDFASYLETILETFKSGWLSGSSAHPVRDLWKRMDQTASWELIWLGHSLGVLLEIDRPWVMAQVNAIKTNDRNRKIGAMFEILFIATFANGTQKVRPAKQNQPGYDAILMFDSGTELRLSLKNLGMSKAQSTFESTASRIYDAFEKAVVASGRRWTGIVAISDAYPESSDWSSLLRAIGDPQFLAGFGETVDLDGWTLKPNAPPGDVAAGLASLAQSRSLDIVSPIHRNERLNLDTSIEKAFHQFEKVAALRTDGISNALVLRVSPSASVEMCAEAIRRYCARVATKFDEVFLYQPAVTLDRVVGRVGITHYTHAIAVGPSRHPDLTAEFAIGRFAIKPIRMIAQTADVDIELDDFYVFQRGDIFYRVDLVIGQTASLHVDFGPGLVPHACLYMMGEGVGTLSPKHPRAWTLSLLED